MLHGVLPLPEPYAGKLACTVLRGLGDGNIPRLPDTAGAGSQSKLFSKAPAAAYLIVRRANVTDCQYLQFKIII